MSRRKWPRGNPPYGRNWPKAQATLIRVVGKCERCGATDHLTVHHRGLPWPDGTPGTPLDKHDLRRANLMVLCETCHVRLERNKQQKAARSRNSRKARHDFIVGNVGIVRYYRLPGEAIVTDQAGNVSDLKRDAPGE